MGIDSVPVVGRTYQILRAVGNFGKGLAGTTGDILTTPFKDDEDKNLLESYWGITKKRTAENLDNIIGPEGIIGEVIEGLPEPVRDAGNYLFDGIEWAGRELVREDITQVFTTIKALTQDFPDDLEEFDAIYEQAGDIAQHRSWGQASVLMFTGGDVLDPDAWARYEDTLFFNVVSGTLDAGGRIFLDPDVVTGKALTALSKARKAGQLIHYFDDVPMKPGVVKGTVKADIGQGPLAAGVGGGYRRFGDDVAQLLEDGATKSRTIGDRIYNLREVGAAKIRVQQLQNDLDSVFNQYRLATDVSKKNVLKQQIDDIEQSIKLINNEIDNTANWLAGRIKERYFKKHAHGDLVSGELTNAYLGLNGTGWGGGDESLKLAMRFFLGDKKSLVLVKDHSDEAYARLGGFFMESAQNSVPLVPSGTVGANASSFISAQKALPSGQSTQSALNTSTLAGKINDDLLGAAGVLDYAVLPTRRLHLADSINTSSFLRSPEVGTARGIARKPIRLFKDMKAQRHVWAGDSNSGEQIVRMMQESALFTSDEITKFRGMWSQTRHAARSWEADKMQEEILTRLIKSHFPDKGADDIAELVKDYRASNRAARMATTSSPVTYDANPKFSVVTYVDDVTGHDVHKHVPLTPAQLRNSFITFDVRQVNNGLKKWAAKGDIVSGKAFPSMVADEIMGFWKAAQLLRPAWAFRVIGDEQLRAMAKIGSAISLRNLLKEGRVDYVQSTLKRKLVDNNGNIDSNSVKKLMGTRAGMTAGLAFIPFGLPGGIVAAGASVYRNKKNIGRLTDQIDLKNQLNNALEHGDDAQAMLILNQLGEGNLSYLGYEFDQAFGNSLDPALSWLKLNSADRQVGYLLRAEDKKFFDELDGTLGEWTAIYKPGDRKFNLWWERIVNDHYAGNSVGRIVFDDSLGGQTQRADELVEWLKTSEGRNFKKDNPNRFKGDPDGTTWADEVVEAADRMVNPALAKPLRVRLAQGQRVAYDDVVDYGANNNLRIEELLGDVHGQQINVADAPDKAMGVLREWTHKAFERIGTLPTDNLSRNPYFKHVYESEMKRRIEVYKNLDGDFELSQAAMRKIESSARRTALQETRELMYDLAEESRFSDLMKNIFPFFNAWQEVLTRWAGLGIENPVFIARAKTALQGEIQAGKYITTSEDEDGTKYYNLRLPDFAKPLFKYGYAKPLGDELGMIQVNAGSFNMVTQGIPGFGPLAQIPTSVLVKDQPRLNETLKFMLPYGPTSPLEAMLPAWAEKIHSALSQDRSREAQTGRMLQHRLTQMATGEIPQIDFGDKHEVANFITDIQTDSRNFMMLRAVATAFSPAQINFVSPFQSYVDLYHRLRREDPKNADNNFMIQLTNEGNEGFFALAARFTKNNDGLPATLPAEEARVEFGDLIQKYPELGPFIIGTSGGGVAKYNAGVYEKQMNEETFPGSGVMRRERLSPFEIIEDVKVREGWAEYNKINTFIENKQHKLGLPNLLIKEAAPLAFIKKLLVNTVKEQNPMWADEFTKFDPHKWTKRISGFRELVANERLSGRDDVQLVNQYLQARDLLTGILAVRASNGGASSLIAEDNQDLNKVWEMIILRLNTNPTFSDVYWRWFEGDSLRSDTWPPDQKRMKEGIRA